MLFQPKNDFVKGFLKEQQLSLELKSAKVADIWHWLPATNATGKAHLPADVTVWSAMEQFKFHGLDNLNVPGPETGELRKTGFEELMAAFYQYKKQQSHE